MADLDSAILSARERWLPMLQSVASSYNWCLHGQPLEFMVDDITPYLGQVEIKSTAMCVRVIQHYYQEAPLVRLLYTQSSESETAWQALIASIRQTITQCIPEPIFTMAAEERVLAKFHNVLAEHNYQRSITQLLSQIVREELKIASD